MFSSAAREWGCSYIISADDLYAVSDYRLSLFTKENSTKK